MVRLRIASKIPPFILEIELVRTDSRYCDVGMGHEWKEKVLFNRLKLIVCEVKRLLVNPGIPHRAQSHRDSLEPPDPSCKTDPRSSSILRPFWCAAPVQGVASWPAQAEKCLQAR